MEKPARIEFLRKLHLFRGLTDTELDAVADELQEKSFEETSTVFIENNSADSLHIIVQGRVEISRGQNNKRIKIATLVKGDYYGEQGLLRSKTRNATVTAERGTSILILFRGPFLRLLKKSPGLRHNFEIMMSSRELARQLKFDWLAENEVIYFLARKHQIVLLREMILPFVMLFPAAGTIGLAYLLISAGIGLVGGFLLVADIAWGLWRYIDWGNDYYIVTNQRVIWLEKVIGFYDSRNEAGIATILSVSTETEFFGRIFDFGTVVVRTYTGQIRMIYVHHPKQAAAMIEEYMNRAKEMGRKTDEETMKQAIRAKLGYSKNTPVLAPITPQEQAKPVKPVTKNPITDWLDNAFRMRTENGNIITYHKHIYGFIRDTIPYTSGILLLILVVALWPLFLKLAFPLWLGALIMLVVAVLFGFIAYEYVDWQNDIYQVTADQIIDISRKPFGTEDRKAAPLENILSTEYKRNGILGMLLNFGTVYIMVGGAQFNFVDVSDPPSVQQDIIRRQQGRIQKKKEVEISAERDRMADWLAMYHRTMDEVNRENVQSRPTKSE